MKQPSTQVITPARSDLDLSMDPEALQNHRETAHDKLPPKERKPYRQ